MVLPVHAFVGGSATVVGTAITGTYASLLTATDDAVLVVIQNTCNQPLQITFDGGDTDFDLLCAADVTLDLRTNNMVFPSPDIRIRHTGTAPTRGDLAVAILVLGCD